MWIWCTNSRYKPLSLLYAQATAHANCRTLHSQWKLWQLWQVTSARCYAMNILSSEVVVVAEQVSLPEYKALARGRKLIVVRTNAAVSSGGWRKDAADAGNKDDEVSQAQRKSERERERDWWHLLAKTNWPHRFCASACVSVCVFAFDESFIFLVRSYVLFRFRTKMMNFSVQSLSHGMDSCARKNWSESKSRPKRSDNTTVELCESCDLRIGLYSLLSLLGWRQSHLRL